VGVTNYQTALTLVLHFTGQWGKAGVLYLFPSLGGGADEDDVVVLRDFIGIPTTLPEPVWVSSLSLPGQLEIEAEINEKHETLGRVEEEISDGERRLALCKRWFRLLYDDGDSLERIVKEALEFLGGSVAKTSKEKDDYRLRVAGYPETVMEVKGTHNSRFTIGALRQLAGWIDEVIAQENTQVKGMFVGNAGRNDEPSTRGNLFEKNNENFAKIRDIVILRSMDLYCITILKHLSKIDVNVLWPEIYGSKGAFDATKYWEMLPNQFKLKSAAPQQGHSG